MSPSTRLPADASAPHLPEVRRCPWCGHATRLDYVHGHAQCATCKKNIEPCCEGEQACPPRAPASKDR